MKLEGATWMFGDDMDTDVMFPGKALRLPVPEASELLFEAVRPGWSAHVGTGDLVVGGQRFGVGSARPVASLLLHIGIAGVLAESMSSLFQRNCINAGLFAVAVPGVTELVAEREVLRVDAEEGRVTALASGRELRFRPLPPLVFDLVAAGGVFPLLRRDGYLPPRGS